MTNHFIYIYIPSLILIVYKNDVRPIKYICAIVAGTVVTLSSVYINMYTIDFHDRPSASNILLTSQLIYMTLLTILVALVIGSTIMGSHKTAELTFFDWQLFAGCYWLYKISFLAEGYPIEKYICPREFLGISWKFLGSSSGIFWEFLWNF